MIAAWMLYIVAISCVLGLTAVALEYGLSAISRPTRWVWALALIATLSLPVYTLLRPSTDQPQAPSSVPIAVSATTPTEPVGQSTLEVVTALEGVSRPLAVFWVLGSLVVLTALAVSGWKLRRQASGWVPARVAGVPVRYSASSGPAVVGCFPGIIVLPRWTRALRHEWQSMMVAHEEEHLRAQDTGLLACALFIVALLPWNPLTWWMFKRLKHAVELDCDRRVLRRGIDRKAYGNLLVELTERARRGPIPAAAFAAPKPLLTRRIRLMMKPTLPRYRLHAVAAAAGAVALAAIGCELPTPPEPDEVEQQRSAEQFHNQLRTQALTPRLSHLPLGVSLDSAKRRMLELSYGTIAQKEDMVELDRLMHGGQTDVESAMDRSDARFLLGERSSVGLREQEKTERLLHESTARLRMANRDDAGVDQREPVIYLDGVRLEQSTVKSRLGEARVTRLAEINPNSVERIEVLKGAAAATIYGASAGGGVIRITTKAAAAASNNH